MFLTLEGIGMISHVDVEIKGITVIAGENNTGKSTIGKALYSAFNSMHDLDNHVDYERANSVADEIVRGINKGNTRRLLYSPEISSLSMVLVKMRREGRSDDEIAAKLKERLVEHFGVPANEDVGVTAKGALEVLSVKPVEILKMAFSRALNSEFNGQINNIYSGGGGEIVLGIRGRDTRVSVRDDLVVGLDNAYSLDAEAVYIDDPFVVDGAGKGRWPDHRADLYDKLASGSSRSGLIDDIITSNKMADILGILSRACHGELVTSQFGGLRFRRTGSAKELSAGNLSSGLKTFAIIQTLLKKGFLKDGGVLILDEPEIHLHPEWQLLFAEAIVLMQKKFDLHIVLNTHSPYFLNAIEVYSARHGAADVCRYYLAERDGESATIRNVAGSPEDIYEKLARPFQVLENEAYDV